MKNRVQPILLLGIFVVLVTSALVARANAQSQDRESRGPDPVVDIDKPQADSRPADVRRIRNRSRNVPEGRIPQDPMTSDQEEGGIGDGVESLSALPALPVRASDAVVMGVVRNATAFLSEDKHRVYSEFEVAVQEVFKNSGSTSIAIGSSIDTMRPGGAIRFPSGHMWHYRIFRQGFPRVGSTYVLFLKEQPTTRDYRLLTGYLLENGKVIPLDGTDNFNPPLASAKYKDADEATFLRDLLQAINGGGQQ